MTFYLASSIISGRLSNEVPGLITGFLNVAGLRSPVSVELRGNFLRDIAGGQIEFSNPMPQANSEIVAQLADHQCGEAGEMTASRRIKQTLKQARPPQSYPVQIPRGSLKNMLFLEWFNQQEQRVVIQAWHWHVRAMPPVWLLPRELEQSLIKGNRARRKAFLLTEGRAENKSTTPQDPFGKPMTLRDLLPEHAHKPQETTGSDPLVAQAAGLRTELKRLEALLRNLQDLGLRSTVTGLLQSIADLSAQLAQTMAQFTALPREGWSYLVMDVEQAMLLLNAAVLVCEEALQDSPPESDQVRLNEVHYQIGCVQRKIGEFLEALRR